MGLADGKLAYQKIKPFIATRGCKPFTNTKEVFTVFVNPLTSQTVQTIQTTQTLQTPPTRQYPHFFRDFLADIEINSYLCHGIIKKGKNGNSDI